MLLNASQLLAQFKEEILVVAHSVRYICSVHV